jgi:beta-exotoxin I transport system ATP-binding protein
VGGDTVRLDDVAVVEARALTKRYGEARGVEDLDFDVEAGEIFGFLGPNGAGKSTTIRTFLDFQRPSSGTARLLGLDSRRDSVEIHRRTGYLPGDLQLLPKLTGRHHVDAFARARGGVRDAAVAGLVERFDIELDRPVRDLSKGNRQKVGLLLAFMHEPELVILDEPTSGLDPLMQEQFQQLVREVVGDGRTVFLSSHSLDEVQRVATSVAVIREGRLVVTDTITNLQLRAPVQVSFRFATPVDPAVFARIPGVQSARADGSTVDLSVMGPVDEVVKEAGRHETVEVRARPADLEDLFLGYYASLGTEPSESTASERAASEDHGR